MGGWIARLLWKKDSLGVKSAQLLCEQWLELNPQEKEGRKEQSMPSKDHPTPLKALSGQCTI